MKRGEVLGKIIEAKSSYLWVKKDTWIHNWYKRLGYTYFKDHEYEKDTIWLTKIL